MSKLLDHCKTSLCVLLFFASATVFAQDTADQPTEEVEVAEESSVLPLQDLRLFTLALDHIRRAYVEPISDKELLENAIRGMLSQLDPHSDYLGEDAFQQLQDSTFGEFSGVGIEIESDSGFIRVISPIDGSPAKKAGIKTGDLIIKLDDSSIQGLSLREVSEKIRGPVGTAVTFTILRENTDKPIDITVVRGTIKSSSTRHRVLDDSIGYIRISQFQADTGKDFSKSIAKLKEHDKPLIGIIVDLRSNPGGALTASVAVVDSLIHEGTIVSTKGRLESSNSSFEATEGDETDGLPIVVLVNGGSASASEIVAGALQDHKRAVIMGTRTFGKGSVQTIVPVSNNKAIKLTTARYFTPSGRSIQAQGIEPDVEIKPATITELQPHLQFAESDLEGHLKNGDEKKENKSQNEDGEPVEITDNQLYEAMNLLKGLAIFNN